MTRKPIIAGNWKMNKNYGEAVVLAQAISNRLEKDWLDRVDVIVCPPFIDLKPVKTVFEFDRMNVELGAQNVHWEEAGAFTGEISVGMLKNVGCAFCIVGHSERRTLMGETNEEVNKKAKALIAANMKPIICVGESLAVREAETHEEFVCAQVKAAFAGIPAAQAKSCVVAYEPIWAIGTGRTATPEQAEAMCVAIRQTLAELYDATVAEGMRILYGGSMNPGNVEMLTAQPNIDGGLIGGASLEADSFVDLIKACL
ncbi:MAG: triose-phosphate isomerase [Coriobacteriia bacterium]|nr:triose-phosphate isomerase [Coriobacteriia bacterium]